MRRSLEPLDTVLGFAAFTRQHHTIYLLNYACHPVVLGPNTHVSADYVGRLVQAVEEQGHKALFMQGFCGDIDPFVNKHRWGSGTEQDLDFYGRQLASRVASFVCVAEHTEETTLRFGESRIEVPLSALSTDRLEEQKNIIRNSLGANAECERFAEQWANDLQSSPLFGRRAPVLREAPLQIMAIGDLFPFCYPAEVFCEVGLALRDQYGPCMLVGYANGNVGRIPTAAAFDNPNDYACYLAPKFYAVLAFRPNVAAVFLRATESLAHEMAIMPDTARGSVAKKTECG